MTAVLDYRRPQTGLWITVPEPHGNKAVAPNNDVPMYDAKYFQSLMNGFFGSGKVTPGHVSPISSSSECSSWSPTTPIEEGRDPLCQSDYGNYHLAPPPEDVMDIEVPAETSMTIYGAEPGSMEVDAPDTTVQPSRLGCHVYVVVGDKDKAIGFTVEDAYHLQNMLIKNRTLTDPSVQNRFAVVQYPGGWTQKGVETTISLTVAQNEADAGDYELANGLRALVRLSKCAPTSKEMAQAIRRVYDCPSPADLDGGFVNKCRNMPADQIISHVHALLMERSQIEDSLIPVDQQSLFLGRRTPDSEGYYYPDGTNSSEEFFLKALYGIEDEHLQEGKKLDAMDEDGFDPMDEDPVANPVDLLMTECRPRILSWLHLAQLTFFPEGENESELHDDLNAVVRDARARALAEMYKCTEGYTGKKDLSFNRFVQFRPLWNRWVGSHDIPAPWVQASA